MPRTSRRLTAPLGGTFALLLALAATAGAAVAPRTDPGATAPRSTDAKPYLDVRAPAARAASGPGAAPLRTLPADAAAARRRLSARLGGQGVLDIDPITATPRALGRLDGTLSGPRAGDPERIARGYVADNAAALGLVRSDLSTLRLARRTAVGGVTYLRWRQELGGIPAVDNDLQASVDGDGRVVGVFGAPRHDLAVRSLTPALSAAQALAALARNVGVDRGANVTAGPTGPREETTFSTGDHAALVLFGDTATVRLAWQMTYRASGSAWYDAVVDATTGAILRRANMVKSVDGLVFGNYPGAPAGGTQDTVALDEYLDPGATTLSGPFAHAWSDIDDDPSNLPSPGEDVDPNGPYPFADQSATNPRGACDAAHQCSWNFETPSSWTTNREQNAVQAFWYASRYHDHLLASPIGFDAASGNFEGDDAVKVETDDGADTDPVNHRPDTEHLDNANMVTLPDGQAPVMQMFLFANLGAAFPFRDVNGGDDASVVFHEYTHGLSNRLITDATGQGALDAAQSVAMGEGWSDWYAKDWLVELGLQPDTAADGEVDMGGYVDAVPHQIRTQPIDCAVGSASAQCPGKPGATARGGYTYGNFARILGRADPHADGEIWGETLWDLRKAVGSPVGEAIITGGMRLSPPQPSFLEMRNAILQAEAGLFGGIHTDAIWDVFARRGMGVFATTVNAADTAPVQDFTTPAAAARAAAVPAGGATPQGVPASAVAPTRKLARPTGRIDRSGVRGRATFTIGCAAACRATATMTVTRARARRVGLGQVTRVARVTRRLTAPGRRTFALTIGRATLRKLRSHGVLSLPVTVVVAIRDTGRQTRTVRRALTVRVR